MTDVPRARVGGADSTPRAPANWTGIIIALPILGIMSGIGAFFFMRLRKRHLAQLAEID